MAVEIVIIVVVKSLPSVVCGSQNTVLFPRKSSGWKRFLCLSATENFFFKNALGSYWWGLEHTFYLHTAASSSSNDEGEEVVFQSHRKRVKHLKVHPTECGLRH